MAVWQSTLGDGYYYGHMASAADNSETIRSYLAATNQFTPEAIIGIIANMDHESYLNPAQCEHGKNMSSQYGKGLVMWTPARTKIEAYATAQGENWDDGDLQMDYLLISVPQGWIKSSAYPYTWDEYKQITDYNLATRVFFYNFERGTWHDELDAYTNYWANTLYGDNPPTPDPPLPPDPEEEDDLLKIAMYLSKMIR